MAHGTDECDEIISGINVTPLVDIVLVVLIIFIVTASFVLRNNIPVELPKAASGEDSAGGLLNLALTADGTLYLDGRPGSLDELPSAVAAARELASAAGRQVTAFVSADVRTPYGAFATAIDRLRLAGVSDIALDTQPVAVGEGGR